MRDMWLTGVDENRKMENTAQERKGGTESPL